MSAQNLVLGPVGLVAKHDSRSLETLQAICRSLPSWTRCLNAVTNHTSQGCFHSGLVSVVMSSWGTDMSVKYGGCQ